MTGRNRPAGEKGRTGNLPVRPTLLRITDGFARWKPLSNLVSGTSGNSSPHPNELDLH